MKTCPQCYTQMKDEARFCPQCGITITGNVNPTSMTTNVSVTPVAVMPEQNNAYALAGFITALVSLVLNIFGVVGLAATILSGIGLSQTKPNKRSRGLANTGLTIGLISLFYGLIQILFFLD